MTTDATPAWRDSDLGRDARVEALLAELTEDERAAIALADWSPLTDRGLRHPHYADCGTGLRGVEGATAFPVGIALAASFDIELARSYGAAVGREARRAGYTCVLGPTLDLARDPRAGRLTEAFGEDPWLTGALGAAHVAGLQGEHVIAQLKHYIAYNGEERRTGHGPVWGRGDAVDVVVSRETLDAAYLRPFRAAVEAGAWSIMGSYNRLNGRYVCESTEVLAIPREEWGWEGFYAPDFIFAVRDPEAALRAGLDVPGLDGSAGRTADMVRAAGVDLRDVIVRRVVRALVGVGLVDHPLPTQPVPPREVSDRDHVALARRAAVASTVLLRNEGGVLPLSHEVGSLAVIGPAGDDVFHTSGGSSAVTLTTERVVSLLDAVRRRAGTSVRVEHAQGSWGDVPLPSVAGEVLSVPDGSGLGVLQIRRPADGATRHEVRPDVDMELTPDEIRSDLPMTWRTRLTPRVTGPHRLSLTVGRWGRVRVDGVAVMAGSREAVRFIEGPAYPLQCVVDLTAGTPVDVEIDYEIGFRARGALLRARPAGPAGLAATGCTGGRGRRAGCSQRRGGGRGDRRQRRGHGQGCPRPPW
jgi:beta-glucosidase